MSAALDRLEAFAHSIAAPQRGPADWRVQIHVSPDADGKLQGVVLVRTSEYRAETTTEWLIAHTDNADDHDHAYEILRLKLAWSSADRGNRVDVGTYCVHPDEVHP